MSPKSFLLFLLTNITNIVIVVLTFYYANSMLIFVMAMLVSISALIISAASIYSYPSGSFLSSSAFLSVLSVNLVSFSIAYLIAFAAYEPIGNVKVLDSFSEILASVGWGDWVTGFKDALSNFGKSFYDVGLPPVGFEDDFTNWERDLCIYFGLLTIVETVLLGINYKVK